MIKIIAQIKAQAILEVAMAIALAIALIIGAVSVWNWLNKTMVEQIDLYRSNRFVAIQKRDSLLFGTPPPFIKPKLTISSMNYGIDAPPPVIDPGQFHTCSDALDAKLERRLLGEFGAFQGSIGLIRGELESVSVKISFFGFPKQPQGLGYWLYSSADAGADDWSNCPSAVYDAYNQQMEDYNQQIGPINVCWKACWDEHGDTYTCDCLPVPKPPVKPDCVSSGSPGSDAGGLQSNPFSKIRDAFNAKYQPTPLMSIKFFIGNDEKSVDYIRGKISEGIESEQGARRALNQMPSLQAYFDCLAAESSECMAQCRPEANEWQRLRDYAVTQFGTTFVFAEFFNNWAQQRQPQIDFQGCFEDCKVQQ